MIPIPTATVTGHFSDESGAPLKNMAVNGTSSQSEGAQTDSNGAYELTVEATPQQRLYAQPWDGIHCYETAFSALISPVAGTTTPDIDLTFKATIPGVIDGTIAPTAQPGETYSVTVQQKLVDGTTEFYLPIRQVKATLQNNESRIHVDGLPAGEYMFFLFRTNAAGVLQNSWGSTEGQTTTLPLGGSVSVTMTFVLQPL